jgi:hypothetical protein
MFQLYPLFGHCHFLPQFGHCGKDLLLAGDQSLRGIVLVDLDVPEVRAVSVLQELTGLQYLTLPGQVLLSH